MKESRFEKGVKTIASEGRADRASKGAYAKDKADANYRNAEAYALKKDAKTRHLKEKNNKRLTKAELAKAKQGYKKTRARMMGVASIGASAANAASTSAKAKYDSEKAVNMPKLDEWMSLINGNAEPAEGTGQPNPGDNSGSGSSTTVAPVD